MSGGAIEDGDVTVVAERDQGAADSRVDVTVGLMGRLERGAQQFGQQWADLGRPSGRRAECVEFGIRHESRRGGLDGIEFGVDLPTCDE